VICSGSGLVFWLVHLLLDMCTCTHSTTTSSKPSQSHSPTLSLLFRNDEVTYLIYLRVSEEYLM